MWRRHRVNLHEHQRKRYGAQRIAYVARGVWRHVGVIKYRTANVSRQQRVVVNMASMYQQYQHLQRKRNNSLMALSIVVAASAAAW